MPTNNPPTMRVKDEFHTWEAGRSILFDDSWNEVVNRSDDIRVVFIVDVLRPMPFRLHAVNWILTRLLMRHSEEARQVMANIKKYS